MSKKKKRKSNMQRNKASNPSGSAWSQDELIDMMMSQMFSSGPTGDEVLENPRIFGLMDELAAAHKAEDIEAFNRAKIEIESLGCTVRMKPNNEFSVLFPPGYM